MIMPEKQCSICGNMKPLEVFENDKRRPDGHGPRCKDCVKAKAKQRKEAAPRAERAEEARKEPAIGERSERRFADGLCQACGKRPCQGIRNYDNMEMCMPCMMKGPDFDSKGPIRKAREAAQA
jgi:hypothetical protein